jgi:HK97 family phage major capsid protein
VEENQGERINSNMEIQKLREEKDKLLAEAKELSEREEITPEDDNKFNELISQVDVIDSKLKNNTRREMLVARENGKAPNVIVRGGKPTPEDAVWAWARAGKMLTREQGAAADHYQIDPRNEQLSLRALQLGTDSEGGYVSPATYVTAYEKKLSFISPAVSAMGSINTSTGESFHYPRVDDSSNAAAVTAEEGPIGTTTDPAFDEVLFPRAFDYDSPIVKVSNQMLRDAIIDIPSLLFTDLFPDRHARAMEAAVFHATADGNGEPEPVIYGVTAGVNLASTNVFTLDKLFSLESALSIAYRSGATFVMHDATWQSIRQITDDTLRPLINVDLQAGVSKQLLGYPVLICNTLTSISSPGDNKPLILFADLNRYKVRRVGSPVVVRLDTLYAATRQTGFLVSQCWDARWVGHKSVCATTLNSYDS